jgi:hypothetical protein
MLSNVFRSPVQVATEPPPRPVTKLSNCLGADTGRRKLRRRNFIQVLHKPPMNWSKKPLTVPFGEDYKLFQLPEKAFTLLRSHRVVGEKQ